MAPSGFRSIGTAFLVLVAAQPLVQAAVRGQTTLSRRYSTDAGLPATPVWALAQDSTGFMWLGTEGGLVRFDGREFRSWAPERIRIAVISVVVSPSGRVIALDARGRLFAVTPNGADSVRVPAGAPHRSVRPLAFDANGRLWMIRGGALAVRTADGGWTRLPPETIGGERPLVIAPAGGGAMLVATNASVWRVEADASSRRVLREGPVIDVLQLADGGVAALGRELYAVDEAGSPRPVSGHPWEMPPGRAIAVAERSGTLWVALDRHLVALRRGRPPDVWGPLDGLEAGGPMLVDHEGSLWIATFTSLLQLPEPDSRIWNDRNGLPSAHTRFLARSEGFVWVATWHGTSHLRRDEAGERMVPLGAHASSRLCADPGGSLWISTAEGLVRVRGREVVARYPDIGWLLGCAPASGGGTWLAASRGFWRATAGSVVPVDGPDAIGGRPLEAVLEDRSGRLWAGTDGFACHREAAPAAGWACERIGDTGKVTEFLELAGGEVWMSTERMGVLRRRGEGWEPLPAAERLPTRAVFGLRPAREGGVWVFGHGFVLRVRPDAERGWQVLERLGAWHGLPTVGGSDILEEEDGTVWIATSLGVVEIPPRARVVESSPPSVALVEAMSGDESLRVPAVSGGAPLRLSHDRNRIQLRFAALSFRDPTRLSYEVRLSPGAPWSATTGPPYFEWPALRPGRYQAEFRASLGGGEWSDAPAAYAFVVLPPWYRRPWALALFALAAGVALWAAHRVRAGFLVRLERQRTRIAMDLHDQIGSGLGSVGILAGIVGREDVGSETRETLARRIAETAEELGSSLSDIIWALDPRAATLHELAGRLAEHGRRLFSEEDVEFVARFPNHWPEGDLPVQLRRNVLLIGLEAMYNAARHADASRVTLSLRPIGPEWELAVADDGVGLAASDPSAPRARTSDERRGESHRGDGHGLEGMRMRAAEIGARLDIYDAPAGGTMVAVRFATSLPGPAVFGRRRAAMRSGAARAVAGDVDGRRPG